MIHLFAFTVLPSALLLLVVGFALLRWQPAIAHQWSARLNTRVWIVAATAVFIMYAAALACMYALPAAMDAVEATVCEIAALMLRGSPAYTTADAAARYSLLYGPLCYLPYVAALALFGSSMLTLKACLIAIHLAAVAVLYCALRGHLARAAAFIATGACVAALLLRDLSIFQIRGDATLLLAVALALLALRLQRAPLAAGVFSIAVAVAIDVKFTAVFYLLVPAWLLYRRIGRRAFAATAAAAAALLAAPFALRTVSFSNYIFWLRAASHHPLSMRLFAVNVLSIVLVLLPALAIAATMQRERRMHLFRTHRVLLAVLAISIAGSVVTGSKVGAGRSHLNGTIIVIAFLTAVLWTKLTREECAQPSLRIMTLVYAVVLLLPVVDQLHDLLAIGLHRRAYALSVLEDIHSVQRAYPNETIEEGYTRSADPDSIVEPVALFRAELVLAGNPVLIDAGALFDMGLSGVPVPPSTVDSLDRCAPSVWLIPRGGAPFQLDNAYATDVPARFPDPHLLPAAFRETFLRHYRPIRSTQYFDVWQCVAPRH